MTGTLRKRSASAIAGLAMLGLTGASLATASSASAATGCYARKAIWQTQAYAGCSSGPGSVKVAARCRNWLGLWAYREGSFVPANGFWGESWATCPAGYTVYDDWYLLG